LKLLKFATGEACTKKKTGDLGGEFFLTEYTRASSERKKWDHNMYSAIAKAPAQKGNFRRREKPPFGYRALEAEQRCSAATR